jgi:hypothetical protein
MYHCKLRHIHRKHNIITHLLSNEIIYINYICKVKGKYSGSANQISIERDCVQFIERN